MVKHAQQHVPELWAKSVLSPKEGEVYTLSTYMLCGSREKVSRGEQRELPQEKLLAAS
jgi:hypothetical protein